MVKTRSRKRISRRKTVGGVETTEEVAAPKKSFLGSFKSSLGLRETTEPKQGDTYEVLVDKSRRNLDNLAGVDTEGQSVKFNSLSQNQKESAALDAQTVESYKVVTRYDQLKAAFEAMGKPMAPTPTPVQQKKLDFLRTLQALYNTIMKKGGRRTRRRSLRRKTSRRKQ